MAINSNSPTDDGVVLVPRMNANKYSKYTKGEYLIITLTVLITLFGFLFRAWRLIREGTPGAYDGYYYLRHVKPAFYEGWFDFGNYTRDPPGFTLILLMAEYALGLPGEQIMWSIYLFPQIIASVQLVIFYVLARRLTKSRLTGLLTMFFISFIGVFVYRNHNVAPDVVVLYFVPFTVYAIYRYLESKDFRFMVLALSLTFVITMVHHMTTFILLAIWHVIILFEVIFRWLVKKDIKLKDAIIQLSILVLIDVFVVVVWVFLLESFPINFLIESLGQAFKGASITSFIVMVVGVLGLLALSLAIMLYNFTNKKVNITIVVAAVSIAFVIFIVAMFFGAATPDQTALGVFVMGSPIIVIPPLFAIGIVCIPKNNLVRSRVIRSWILTMVVLTGITAVVPIMSSFIARVVIYLIELAAILCAFGILFLVSQVKRQKLKTIVLLALVGSMTVTTSFAYPPPKDNFNMQEVFWQAEFDGLEFLIFTENISHPTWLEAQHIMVDADWRFSAILEGYAGFESGFDIPNASWLEYIVLANTSLQANLLTNTSPWDINPDLKYVVIDKTYFELQYLVGWPVYGGNNTELFRPFPEIDTTLAVNPYVHRIYSNNRMFILLPFQTSS